MEPVCETQKPKEKPKQRKEVHEQRNNDSKKTERKRPKTHEYFQRLRSLHDAHRIDANRIQAISRIGEGGFALVELCWLTNQDGSTQQVAVKRVRPDVLKHATQLKLFTNESDILVKLKHQNIVKLIGLGSIDDSTDERLRDSFFLVEELVDGGSLRLIVLHQMIHAPQQLYRIRDAVRWCIQMAKALQYLQSLDPVVVHRDLKPDNVLLTCLDPWEADIKIADFGLSVMIPNKHLATEVKAGETSARDPNREARWRKQMAPSSSGSVTGAAAMLQLMDISSLGPGLNSAIPTSNSYLPSTTKLPANGVYTNGNAPDRPSPAGNATQVVPVSASGVTSRGPMSKSRLYAYGPTSRTSLNPYVPGSRAGGLYGPNSRTGMTSNMGLPPTSRSSLGPVSSLLSKLGLGPAPTPRNLECPSGIMFDLTSMTGSLLYMSPEVFKGEPYNYKADTFSFGVLMYELLHQRLIMASLLAQQIEDRHTFENEIMEFTKCVSAGFRPPIEDWLPDYVQQLISACWAQNPTDRPSMTHIISELERFLASPELTQIDKDRAPGCCRVC